MASDIVANSNGYGQTKFVAEALVRRATLRSASGSQQFAIVSPGLVIGTPTEGVSNADDWIWRLAAACIRVGIYNGDQSETWIPISDAAATATTILDTALGLGCSAKPPVVPVKGGMAFGEFWKILSATGYELEPRSGADCAAAIRKDIETSKEAHPLWTLSDMLRDLEETAKDTWAASWQEGGTSSIRLKVALKKSVEFLTKVGFLPPPKGISAIEEHGVEAGAFSRSSV